MWTKASLMERTKCARCGQRGHWARTCTNPPDERGKRRSGMSGFVYSGAESATENNPFIMCTYTLAQCKAEKDAESFNGLTVSPGRGLLDTGAQHGVIGEPDYEELCEELATHGLQPREVPTLQANAVGVGGITEFLKSAEVPIGIQGVSGTLTLNVIKGQLPLLLPMGFCKKLGLILDTTENTATWKYLDNKISKVVTLPSDCLLYTSPSPRDRTRSRMPSSA